MRYKLLKSLIFGAFATGVGVAGAADLSYRSWDGWSAAAPASATSTIAGSLASLVAVPTTGTATYKGAAAGVENRGGNFGLIKSTANLSADFAARTLTGSFDDMKRVFSGTPLGGSATPVNAALNATWGADNRVAGTLTAPTSNNGVMSGRVNAAFFGFTPAANVAGTWTLSGGNTTAGGGFAAKKQ